MARVMAPTTKPRTHPPAIEKTRSVQPSGNTRFAVSPGAGWTDQKHSTCLASRGAGEISEYSATFQIQGCTAGRAVWSPVFKHFG